ncbi:LysR substrate-binding domain-containing protein [Paraclostridium bifermentans]|uniref:LysR substrate-binding domain-containing protein n=1 Tax=Paraclostridium bifermentans TaxID=1490 RepID=UPI0029102324|nr:LysR substrate-binding domain-containing protein [Paraclostridium bifermentans]MDU3337424.1 LysR substrate-binding domain-containing protein [Paraclostridium bifermentans]
MIEEFKTFIAVVEHQNFTKAGESINLSQPTVSTHIKNLENYFNTTLINRSIKQKNISITDNGYLLYKRAREIITSIESIKDELNSISSSIKGHIKIGASLTIAEYFLPNFLAVFSEKYPDIEVEMLVENTHKICEKVKSSNLDIGLVEGSLTSFDFNQKFFFEDSMILTFSPDLEVDPLNFNIDSIKNKKWIVREEGSGTREYLNIFLSNNKITPRQIMVLGSNHAVKEAVKSNLGVSIISKLVTDSEGDSLATVSLNDTYNRYFSFITPKDIKPSSTTTLFIDELNKFSNFEK